MGVGENQTNLREKNSHTMALDCCALLTSLSKLKDTDLTDRLRSALERVYQELINAEAAAMIGALPGEHSGDRTTYLDGSRPS